MGVGGGGGLTGQQYHRPRKGRDEMDPNGRQHGTKQPSGLGLGLRLALTLTQPNPGES